jgi:hypothetical protein
MFSLCPFASHYPGFTFRKITSALVLFICLSLILAYADPYNRHVEREGPCQIDVLGFEDKLCAVTTFAWDDTIYTRGRTFSTTIKDTNGITTPFNWSREVFTPLEGTNLSGIARVRSLAYSPHNVSCGLMPMQFTVYNDRYISAVEYFTLGKGPSWCMIFSGNPTSTFTAYKGVTMLASMNGTDVIGGGDEDGYYYILI